jgi:hypothetical protein
MNDNQDKKDENSSLYTQSVHSKKAQNILENEELEVKKVLK